MNNIKIYGLFLFLFSGLISSCSDEFLESKQYGVLAEDEYFQTPGAAMKIMTNCYSPMLEHFPFAINKGAMGSEITDDAEVGGSDAGDRPQIPDVATGRPITSNALLLETWQNRYTGIGYCNYGLAGLSKEGLILRDEDGNSVPESSRQRYLSEMKFLRAFYYFDLVMAFKNVPLLIKPAVAEDRYSTPKSTIEELRIQILKDLDEGIADPNLPRASAMSLEDELGRVSKDAVYSFKARVTLFFAGLMEQGLMEGNSIAEYEIARDAAAEVVNNGGFALMSDYQDLFRGDYVEGTQSEECVFTVLRKYVGDIGFSGDAFAIMNAGRNEIGGWGGNCPTKDLAAEYETGDPRKLFTIISHLDTFPRVNGTKEIHNYSGYYNEFNLQHSRKAFVPDTYREEGDLMRTKWSPYYIRYADVLLMYAEALFKTGGNTQQVVDLINEVRHRAFVTTSKVDEEAIYRKFQTYLFPIDDDAFNNTYKVQATDDLLKVIKHERRVELGMESLRFFDLLRWGDYVTNMSNFYTKYSQANKGKNVTSSSWPFPIPQVEIDRSGGVLIQNPNY